MKTRWLSNVLSIIILLGLLFGLNQPIALAGKTNPPPEELTLDQLQKDAATQGATVTTGEQDLRYEKIKQVLGEKAPKEKDFKVMSSQKFHEFMVTNAKILNVGVYENVWDATTKEFVTKKIAGPDNQPIPEIDAKPIGQQDESPSSSAGYPAPKNAPEEPTGVVDGSEVIVSNSTSAYPAPGGEVNASKGSSGAVPNALLTLNRKLYLTTVFRPADQVMLLKQHMDQARLFMIRLYKEDPAGIGYAYISEYNSCALGIKANADTVHPMRFLGEYFDVKQAPVGKILTTYVGPDFYWADSSFMVTTPLTSTPGAKDYGLEMRCDTYFSTTGNTIYQIKKTGWFPVGTPSISVYFGDTRIINDAATYPINTFITFTYPNDTVMQAHRFTIRHANRMGYFIFSQTGLAGDSTKASRLLNTTLNWFNDYHDVYAPMFDFSSGWPIDFMYQRSAYPDCDLIWDGVDSTIKPALTPHRYGYESKICVTLGRDTYITMSKQDYLIPVLQAIHVLNTTGNPDYRYPHPFWPLVTTSARECARWVEANGWNGIGIKAWNKDPAYASSIRTDVFARLEVMLGYAFGDNISRDFADETENILLATQWGVTPFNYNQAMTVENGLLTRNSNQGGQFLSWAETAEGSYSYQLPPYGYVNELVDLLNMPNETTDAITSNPESTGSYWAALHSILWFKYGVWYP